MDINNRICVQWGFIQTGVQHRAVILPTSYTQQYQLCLQGYDGSTWQNYPVISKNNISSFTAHWHNNIGTGGWICVGY